MTGHGETPDAAVEGFGRDRTPTHRTRWQSHKLGRILLASVPSDVDRRDIVDRDRRLRTLASDPWYRRVLNTPLVDVDTADRDATIDRFVDDSGAADRILRWMEGRCHACGRR